MGFTISICQVRFLTVLVLVLSASLIHSYSSGPPALAPSPENFSQVHAFGSPSLEPLGLSLAGDQARDPSDSTRDPVGGQEDNSYSAVSAGALAETERRESHEKDKSPLALVSRGATWIRANPRKAALAVAVVRSPKEKACRVRTSWMFHLEFQGGFFSLFLFS